MKKITATFQPQAYVNDQIIDIDGAVECDVTDFAATIDQTYLANSLKAGIDGNDVFAEYLGNGDPEIKQHIGYLPFVIRLTQEQPRYDFTGWEAETDLDNDYDREGVYFLTIRDNEEEMAIIIHRASEKYPLDSPVAEQKVERAQKIVDALNAYQD